MNLKNINLPDSLTFIGKQALSGCGFTEITIPSGVSEFEKNYIDMNPFGGCVNLTSINVSPANNYFSSENGVLFNKDKTIIMSYPEAKNDPSYTIPNSVKIIAETAFIEAKFTSVVIPDGTETIGISAFIYSNLTEVTIPQSVTHIGYTAFYICPNLKVAYFKHD